MNRRAEQQAEHKRAASDEERLNTLLYHVTDAVAALRRACAAVGELPAEVALSIELHDLAHTVHEIDMRLTERCMLLLRKRGV